MRAIERLGEMRHRSDILEYRFEQDLERRGEAIFTAHEWLVS